MKNSPPQSKLKELAIHISQKAAGDNHLGITKLNKLLFLSDFHYYFKTGKSITGQKYLKLPRGPVPKDMKKIEKSKTDIVFRTTDCFGYSQKKPVALRAADLSNFSADEIAFVDDVINVVCKKNTVSAKFLSDESHEYIGWAVAPDGGEIPYNTIFLEKRSKQKASPFDKLLGEELLTEMGGDYGFKTT